MTIESADEFVRLRTSDDPVEYRRAAHDDAPLEVWLDVIASYPEMRSWVAHNKTIPIEVLEQLAGDDDPSVRSMVAMKRKATAAILERLARDVDSGVRLHVARHRNTPPRVLEELAKDEWDKVRNAAVANAGK
jgi:hypothetical protein